MHGQESGWDRSALSTHRPGDGGGAPQGGRQNGVASLDAEACGAKQGKPGEVSIRAAKWVVKWGDHKAPQQCDNAASNNMIGTRVVGSHSPQTRITLSLRPMQL